MNPPRMLWLVLLAAVAANPLPAATVSAGSVNQPLTLDPAQSLDDTSSLYLVNLYETLVRLNPDSLVIEPWLAESWQALDGGRTWKFRLRPGVRFHDGTECNADAVVFSFKRQMDPRFPHRHYDLPMFAEIFSDLRDVRKVDERTVSFHLGKPFAPFLATLTSDCAAIVSPAAVIAHKADFPHHPCGTGPFRLGRWIPGKQLVLEANRHYWRGAPAIDGFVVSFGYSYEQLHRLFRQGRLDMIFTYSISGIAALKRSQWMKLMATPILANDFIAFNCAAAPLNRRGLRRALGLMWDQRVVRLVFQDSVRPSLSLLPAGMLGNDNLPEPPPPGPAAARAQLAAEGLPPPVVLEFLIADTDSLGAQMVFLYAQNLRKIGIELRQIRLRADELQRRVSEGRFQMTRSGWIADYPDPDSLLSPPFSTSMLRQGFANLAGVRTREIEAMLRDGRLQSDPVARAGIYRRLLRLIRDEVWLIPVAQPLNVIPYNSRLQGMSGSPMGRIDLFNLSLK